jgi:hypothetical protein
MAQRGCHGREKGPMLKTIRAFFERIFSLRKRRAKAAAREATRSAEEAEKRVQECIDQVFDELRKRKIDEC